MSCKNVMQDCRAFTDYTPNCQLNESLKYKYAPGASSEYRHFLQMNACQIMDELRQRSVNNNKNPTGCECKCNFSHPPHDTPHKVKYQWQPSATWLQHKNKDFNQPLPSPGSGRWTNYC